MAGRVRTDRTGEKRMMNCGMEATIINYRRSDDIDVEFNDGYLVKHRTYHSFKCGRIINPVTYVGREKTMENGCKAKIIACRSQKDMDIQFEDGLVLNHITYAGFSKGEILHPSKYIGETIINNDGYKMEIIAYRHHEDIDIRFEDGVILKHRSYSHFVDKTTKHPKAKDRRVNESRKGETKMMNCGMKATIINYTNVHDIDIEFEDGCKLEHKAYSAFKKGQIKNPNLYNKNDKVNISRKNHKHKNKSHIKDRTGEEKQMQNGIVAKISKYRSCNDIDVIFADGTLKEHTTYAKFKKGKISNKNISMVQGEERVGEVNTMTNGMRAEIIAYYKFQNITIKFEDGVIKENVRYAKFKKGYVSHPTKNIKQIRKWLELNVSQ